jgi:hypothetical protein
MTASPFHADYVTAPAQDAFAVTPSDVTNFSAVARSLWIGVAGDVTLITLGSNTAVLFKNVPQGSMLPVMCIRVNATGTTATNIVGII